MNPKIIHAIALLTAIASGVLASADRIAALSAINPTIAHLWPFVLTTAIVIINIGKLLQPPPPSK